MLEVGYGGMRDNPKQHLAEDKDLTEEQTDFYRRYHHHGSGASELLQALLCTCKRRSRKTTTPNAAKSCCNERDVRPSDGGKAQSFYEAVEAVYLTHLLMMIESNVTPSPSAVLTSSLAVLTKQTFNAGKISKEKALEILTHFFIMTNSLNKVRPWGHTQYSGG